MNNLTEVKKDWKSIPYFKQYTPTKFYAILGCFIVGFDLKALRGWEEYRPHFVMYPLWKNSVNDCLHHSYLLTPIKDKKGLDFNIPYFHHHEHFVDFVSQCHNRISFIFEKNISSEIIRNYLGNYSNNLFIRNIPVLQAYVVECVFCFSLFIGTDMHKVFYNMLQTCDKWDKKKFIYWGKTYDEWLESLISMTNDRDSFLKQIETNINSEKLRKLPRYNLIP